MKRLYELTPKIYKLSIVFTTFFFSSFINAQNKLPDKAIEVLGGYSKHGSGDMNGIVFGAGYVKYLTNKFSLNYNIKGTINDGKETILINDIPNGSQTDASIRFTTAGVQLGVNGGISLIRNSRHEFTISLGAFGRYQSASNGSDGYAIYSPVVTGLPLMLIAYDNRTPQETFSVGGLFQFEYNYTFTNKIYIGLVPGFQTDTNGDAIPQVALTIGRRL